MAFAAFITAFHWGYGYLGSVIPAAFAAFITASQLTPRLRLGL